jgi:hypothetical protein
LRTRTVTTSAKKYAAFSSPFRVTANAPSYAKRGHAVSAGGRTFSRIVCHSELPPSGFAAAALWPPEPLAPRSIICCAVSTSPAGWARLVGSAWGAITAIVIRLYSVAVPVTVFIARCRLRSALGGPAILGLGLSTTLRLPLPLVSDLGHESRPQRRH